ncbi:MAG: hypothetical protein MUF72_23410 [Elainella sp. Prado103]|jgi:hypothetical protein|nr:hypothetical protein [Elainella sp. Prado103]
MTPQLMIQPSAFMHKGIQIVQASDFALFRFTPQLQARSDELIARQQADLLTPDAD